ncbi:MAG: radical SAM protein, partial [Mobilitalea sp.]
DDKTYIELAFFGGSFTGIDARLQEKYLKLAAEYKKSGKIHAIRLSTRPDYISTEILDRLKLYLVDTIELGVQSLHDEVLDASNRGHKVLDVYKAVSLIKSYGFHLGIQLMIGLPGDTKEHAVLSARLAALLKPECIRIYPTLVIKETELLELCNQGKYTPLSIDQAVDWTKEMYQVFLKAQIPVIRMGLQPTELIAEGKEVLYGPFHPAFRQLVESSYFLDLMRSHLNNANTNLFNQVSMVDTSLNLSTNKMNRQVVSLVMDKKNPPDITILCNPKDLSQVIGHKRFNIIELKKEYPKLQVVSDENIKPMTVKCIINYLQEE